MSASTMDDDQAPGDWPAVRPRRSTRKPPSLAELSLQLTLALVDPAPLVATFWGMAGRGKEPTVAMLLGLELLAELMKAYTAKK